MTPWEKYQDDLSLIDFQYDEAQENAVKELQRLYDELTQPQKKRTWRMNLKAKFSRKSANMNANSIQGIYFWGGVGRGKTYLVDTFYDCLPFENKMRVHFHRFMHRIHKEMQALKQQEDPLKSIAKKIAAETRIICFDEFFVSDITDAMILGTLMQYLFDHGIVLVATSNIEPDGLYKNGLQRARFLPAIELINENTRVVNVDSGNDYRLRTLEQAEIYHYPLDDDAQANLDRYFDKLAAENFQENVAVEIEGRDITCMKKADSVVMFDFLALCDGPRSQNDYIELSRIYQSVLLANVKQMDASKDDIARRFIAMVDEFYERKVKLIISAEVDAEELYVSGRLSFEFQRCLSRLQEMQSREYLALAHLA
ncbi:cell division protein ZapE [Glaciecola petra]|uniref:Cell division protein ZapE n=1 Tax=Glaciecola petra TaxID=3075602 RepID=A0ABU2ZTK4_9ALTE|nr:cell division protein ZapE [Aestuariibacter sp. P117]MDT0595978.1 cell division protein ZapE [Aestuariibacter sp. P117]